MDLDFCAVEGCERPRRSRAWCNTHYERWRRHGDPLVVRSSWDTRARPAVVACSQAGCSSVAVARGMCNTHYTRFRKHGDPTVNLDPKNLTVAERFWRFAVPGPAGECWAWTGHHDAKGYARMHAHGQRHYGAYRVAYELHVGPIPDGLQIDHLCANEGCVNPSHLEPVTLAENVRRRDHARKASQ